MRRIILSYSHINFFKFAVSKSTQTESDFSSLVATNAELVKLVIANGKLMEQKDAKYIHSLQERFLLDNQYQELIAKSAQQQVEIESLENRIDCMMPAPAPIPVVVDDLIAFEGI